MIKEFVSIEGINFVIDNKPFKIKGVSLGSYLNLEHFMIKLPGIESNIRKAIIEIYGRENALNFWQNFVECFFTEEDASFLREIGVNTIRLPFNYHHFLSDDGVDIEEGFNLIERVLKICERNDIYVILDLHAAIGGQNPDWHSDNPCGESLFWRYLDFQEKTISLWKRIAERFKNRASIIGYDVLNEPVIEDRKISGIIVNNFYKKVISAIREVDKNHIIFLEGDFYATDTSRFEVPEDPLVAYSIHFYPFFHVEKQREGYRKMNRSERKEFLKEILKKTSIDDIQKRLKRPVWCGETGVPHKEEISNVLEELLDETLEVLEELNISWSIWTYKDAKSMGMIYCGEDTPWMKLSKELLRDWRFLRDFNFFEEKAKEYVRGILPEITPSTELIRKIMFRLLSMNDLIMVEKLKLFLKDIPFDKFYSYPESFLFKNCNKWERLVKVIKRWL
ncbi:MAG: glycoside hydrolase family 5 protein [Brevinematia bacterium]